MWEPAVKLLSAGGTASLKSDASRRLGAALRRGAWLLGSRPHAREKGTTSVVLTTHIEGLGRPGQVVRVARGHARNRLVPLRHALPAVPKYIGLVEQLRLQGGREEAGAAAGEEKEKLVTDEDRLEEVEAAARRLDKHRLSVRRHTLPKTDTVRFPVTPDDVVKEVLRQVGIVLVREHLAMPHPLISLGEHEVALNFPKEAKLPGEKEILTLRVHVRRP